MKKLLVAGVLGLAAMGSYASMTTDNHIGTLPAGEPKLVVSPVIETVDKQHVYTIADPQHGTVCTIIYADYVTAYQAPAVSCVFVGNYPDGDGDEYGAE